MHNHTRWSITSPAYLYDIHAILSSSSSLPLDLTSCTYRDHARVCEAIMSSAELEQPREDVVVGEETGGASTSPPRHPSAVSPKAGAKARSRPQRPRIDLDEQIAHANKLAEVSKKMLLAAKSAQKTQKKQKQRLIRKAGKLSAEDLERIAVLKRCGLYADEEEQAADTENGSGPPVDTEEVPVAGPADKKVKLADMISKISGADLVMQTLAGTQASTGSASGSASSRDGVPSASGSNQSTGQPRGRRLHRSASRATLERRAETAVPEDDA